MAKRIVCVFTSLLLLFVSVVPVKADTYQGDIFDWLFDTARVNDVAAMGKWLGVSMPNFSEGETPIGYLNRRAGETGEFLKNIGYSTVDGLAAIRNTYAFIAPSTEPSPHRIPITIIERQIRPWRFGSQYPKYCVNE